MCGRIFCLFESTEELLSVVNKELSVNIETDLESSAIFPRYNVAPTTNIPVISDNKKLVLLPWGFKLGSISVINARNEEIETKKSFKDLIDSERCVVVCSGYFEWDQKTPKNHKHKPYSFRLIGHQVCFIAGLRNPHTDSLVLVTREAVDSISEIHTRMPVILLPENIENWLNNDSRTWESLTSSIIDHETYSGMIEFEAVNPIVNDVKNESSLCLQSYDEFRKEGKNSFFQKFKKTKLDQ